MEREIYSEWKAVSLSPLPEWALAILMCVLLLAAFIPASAFLKNAGKLRLRYAFLLTAFRAAACACAAVLAFEPGIKHIQMHRIAPRAAVILDVSASMSLTEADGKSRGDKALQALERLRPALEKISERFRVEFFGFDGEVHPWGTAFPAGGDTVRFTGKETDVLGAVMAAASGRAADGPPDADTPFAGALLISDGADTSGRLSVSASERKLLEDLGAPISTVLTGQDGLPDISVERAAADGFAFIRSQATVTAYIRYSGFSGRRIPVTLKMDGRPAAVREVVIPGSEAGRSGVLPVEFRLTPDRTGDFSCMIEIPVQEGESSSANNRLPFPLKVIRDRVRILHVSGRPTWDLRFLRSWLKENPNVDLVSSYILRDLSDNTGAATEGELALIPFPQQEVFHDQLSTFDVVILQNFSLEDRTYSMGRYIPGIARYVLSGGALVVIGGENTFRDSGYADSELGKILPVVSVDRQISEAPFRARLTPSGAVHPVTKLSSASSSSLWESLPPVDGVHVTKARPDAVVLLDHPFETSDGQNLPVAAVRDADKGRVMAILSDATWQWAFGAGDGSNGSRVYDRFWSQAIRWLVHDADFSLVKISIGPSTVESGARIPVRVEVRRADYSPASGVQVTVAMRPAEVSAGGSESAAGNSPASEAAGETAVRKVKAVTGEDGTAFLDFSAGAPGAWRIDAEALEQDHSLGTDSLALAVRDSSNETSSYAVGEKLLREIALVTGGTYWKSPDELENSFPLKDEERVNSGVGTTVPLGHQELLFALMCLALGAQWFLSRRWGASSR